MKKILHCMVGLPRSGKTTKASGMGCPIVCPDAIRLALHGRRFEKLAEDFVWAIAKTMVRALFLAGHDEVVLDATNNTVKRRAMWESDDWETEFHFCQTSKAECIRRARGIGDEEIIATIERMDKERDWIINGDDYVPGLEKAAQ